MLEMALPNIRIGSDDLGAEDDFRTDLDMT